MSFIRSLKEKIISGIEISKEDAQNLVKLDYLTLFQASNEIREHFLGKEIILCSIVNAKSGFCAEDCAFCGQSSRFTTNSPKYTLQSLDQLKSSVDKAYSSGTTEFSFVTSGNKINNRKELKTLGEAIKYTKENSSMEVCASLGLMNEDELLDLKNFGLDHFHHNLETARSHFPKIITSHTYDQEIKVVKHAKKLGLHTCCGGVFGMGESWEQRLELAFDLRDLEVDSIPINFLNPILGTALDDLPLLEPYEALKIVAIYRFIFPSKNVMVMGGRERILRDLQSWIFFAGANGMLLGNYLTTTGRSVENDLQMIKDLGFIPKSRCLA